MFRNSHYWFILISTFVQIITTQYRTCIYKSSPSNSLINLQHELYQANSNSCIACLPKCRTCLSANDQTCADGHCQSAYYYEAVTKQCYKCQKMCEACTNSNTCDKCIDGFYLSNNICKSCPTGVLQCTSSSILQCFDGYYYDSQTYICRKCTDLNCHICTAKAQCNECNSGYILNSDGISCLSCGVLNCAKCINVGNCQACSIGYQLISNSYCSQQICNNISNCLQCTTNTSTSLLLCTLCQSGYFLLSNSCHYGASLLCEYSLTQQYLLKNNYTLNSFANFNLLTDYGSCASCNQEISYQADNTQTFCIPKLNSNANEVQTSFHAYHDNLFCNIPYLTVSNLSESILYIRQMPAAYQIRFDAVFLVIGSTVGAKAFQNSPNLILTSLNIENSLTQSQIRVYQLFCSFPTLPNTSMIVKVSSIYKIVTDYPKNITINFSTGAQTLKMNFTINKSIIGVSNSKLAIKQLYVNIDLCQKQFCLQCMSAFSCTKCRYPYYIQNFKCVSSCDIGYYSNSITYNCLPKCQFGFYPDPLLDYTCSSCLVSCLQCVNLQVCTKCAPKYFLTIEGKCSSSCQNSSGLSYYFPNSQSNECEKCHNPCKTCSLTANNCTSCLIGFQFYNIINKRGGCLFQCPLGYFEKVIIQLNGQVNSKCNPCSLPCRSCFIQNLTCTSCIQNFYLSQTTCLQVCPKGFYGTNQRAYFNENGLCKKCNNPCLQCSFLQNNCTKCNFGMYLIIDPNLLNLGKCLSACPNQLYFPNTQLFTCSRCSDSNCLQCKYSSSVNQKNICTKCLNGYVLQNSKCLLQCTNAWAVDNICKGCPFPCRNCTGTSQNNFTCLSCLSPYNLQSSRCSLICSDGYFGNWSSNACFKCPNQCKLCFLPISQTKIRCFSCNINFTLYNYQCIQISTGCPSSTYLQIYNSESKCLPCWQYCLQCKDEYNKCIKCPADKYLFELSFQCVDNCPHGYFNNPSSSTCTACSINCSDCLLQPDNCTTCKLNSYKYYNTSTNLYQCLTQSQCGSKIGFYANKYNGQCLKCSSPCVQCISQAVCTKCDNSSNLFSNSCVLQCSNGYYSQNQLCKQCSPQCFSCSSYSKCLICKPNYFFRVQSLECLSQCYITQFGNRGTMTCQTCKFPCNSCQNTQYCTTCQNDSALVLLNGKCLIDCPVGFYQFIQNNIRKCLACLDSCQICQSAEICQHCALGYFLFQNKCLSQSLCPAKYYADYDTRTCSKCRLPCIQCSSKYQCLSCISTHSLKDSSCYISCPIGSYSSNGICVKCATNCLRCTQQQKCIDCDNNTYLYTNNTSQKSRCVNFCPIGTYQLTIQSICQACLQQCKTCYSRPNNCTSCMEQKVLQNFRCLRNCSLFYFETQLHIQNGIDLHTQTLRICEKCNTSCYKCLSYQYCTACHSSYLVQTLERINIKGRQFNKSYCVTNCPLSTFKNSQEFVCQSCQNGCLICTSYSTCLKCSANYFLYNIYCIYKSCPQNLYTIVDENKCVEESYCRSNQNIYMVYIKLKQCYRKDSGGCPGNLVRKNQHECIDSCMQGYLVNFDKLCIKTDVSSKTQFGIYPIPKNGYIQVIVSFNSPNFTMDQAWTELFSNITVERNQQQLERTESSLKSVRLLTNQQIPIQIIPNRQTNITNILIFKLVPQSPIPTPSDLLITVKMSQPYTSKININGLPLQNWYSQSTLKSYTITQDQIQYRKSGSQPVKTLPILLVIIVVVVSGVNLVKSGKIYLMISVYDFMGFLYLFNYLDVYWPFQMRLFLDTFSVIWLKLFSFNPIKLVFSPQKVHANAGDMHLLRNILSNLVLFATSMLVYLILIVVRKLKETKKKNEQIQKNLQEKKDEPDQPSKHKKLDKIIQKTQKIAIAIGYLSLPNILYFSSINFFYKNQSATLQNQINFWYVLSIILFSGLICVFIYIVYCQTVDKIRLDNGINPLKKKIIIYLPIYIGLRKFLITLFIAVLAKNSAFTLCFALITTAFIFILIWWFEPYNNKIRYRLALLDEASKFVFFLFTFIYVCNYRSLMQGGYFGFLIFLATLVIAINLIYPCYHLYVLLNLQKCFSKLNSETETQNTPNHNIKLCIQQSQDQNKNNKKYGQQEDSCNSQENQNTQKPQKQNIQAISEDSCTSIIKKYNQKSNNKKQSKLGKKIPLPKNALIQGQTDHQADQSSQQGDKNKMKLADYTVRLTKRGKPVIKQFKNYDFNENDQQDGEENLVQKQIHLSRLIQKQKSLHNKISTNNNNQ